MFIRRTTIKSRRNGEPYYAYAWSSRFVPTKGVRQRTLVNLGRHFDVPREQRAALAQRIDHLLSGQQELFPLDMDPKWESTAQRYAALVVCAKAKLSKAEGGACVCAHREHSTSQGGPDCVAIANRWGRLCIN